MPTDLMRAKDHPALVLRGARARVDDLTDHGLKVGEHLLRTYEESHGVTFAALDNEALASVREAYEKVTTAQGNTGLAMANLIGSLGDLLGLSD